MTTVGYSTLDVIPSVKNLRSQLEAQTSRDFAAAGRRGGEQFGDAAGKAAGGRFKSKFGSVAKDAFAPIAGIVAGAAVVGLFKDAIDGASDLAESGNKIQVIFGDAAKQVNAFAAQGAKALGQTRLDVLNAAGSFGTFGKAAGLSGKGLADFSTKLVGLSTDMASFFNTSPEQAIEAIGAALRGEAEPIRAYGVLLDDATLRQEAMRQGLIATTKQALTPQQKVLAAYQVILNQTKDAQGDFARTSGGLANQQRILSAQWEEMKTQLGSKLLPAATETVKVFNNGVLPAMSGAGGAIKDAASAFGDLPGPVKAATAAFIALRIASATGIGTAVASGATAAGSALVGLRLRAMLAADAFRQARAGQVSVTAGSGQFVAGVGRMSASMAALRTASAGAGAGLRRGLSGALSIVGGPWGAAFLAGTGILMHFWQEHQKAKARVEDFTAAIKADSGAMAENTRQSVVNALEKDGLLKNAQKLGFSLQAVTDAAMGSKPAMDALNSGLEQMKAAAAAAADGGAVNGQEMQANVINAKALIGAIGGTSGALADSAAAYKRQAAAMEATQTAQSKTSDAIKSYTTELDNARQSVRDLMDAENKRRGSNLSAFQDRTRLAQVLKDAQEEAAQGTKTLAEGSAEGLKNRDALASLADAWNSSADSVKNAKGAYDGMRANFIKVAEQMGATKTRAKFLADQLLQVPKQLPIEVHTRGMDRALADLKRLKEFAGIRINITAQATKNRAALADIQGHATGGLIRGPGSGTSDSVLMWGSNGEFMQRKAAVDFYGVDFMRALNALQVPRFASGGPIGPTTTTAAPMGQHISGTLGIDRDGVAYIYGVARSEVDAAEAASLRRRRLSSLDAVPR